MTIRRPAGLALAVAALLLGGMGAAIGAEHSAVAARWTAPAFPLAVAPGGRYLIDAAGKPFLIHGDAAWSLIAALPREEVDEYLDDRRSRGFNTILVSLLEHRFSAHPPANAYGQAPFLTAGDYATPNEAYFQHADWVLRRAAEKGFLVVLAPSFLGINGGDEGWYAEMAANGATKMRQFGRYLGQRYGGLANILWLHGGDYNPPRQELVSAIAEGIREFSPHSLHSAHGAPETAVLDRWRWASPWLQVNTIYTYGSVAAKAVEAFERAEPMPVFLVESGYENEHGLTERDLRRQAYQAVLSGADGQIFGNNPIWHFNGPGLEATPLTWRQALDSRGARSMTHLRALLEAVSWWRLRPDDDNRLLVAGMGAGTERAVAAIAADRARAVLYLPKLRAATVDLRRLAGPRVDASWFDPASGQSSPVAGSPFSNAATVEFRPSGGNSANCDDWVLVLTSRS